MNVSHKSNDTVSAIIKMDIEKNDYQEEVEKKLREYRKKANVPGFRKGMVPVGMIKKMYGKQLLVETINRLVSEHLFSYIRENNLDILGEPLPNESEQQPIDFDTQESFEFIFDVALAPQTEIKLSKRDKLSYYEITIDEAQLKEQITGYRRNFGSYEPADMVEESDLIKGVLTELHDGTSAEEPLVVEEAIMMPLYIKDAAEKEKFLGAKINDVITFNPHKAYEGHEAELASLLKIAKEVATTMTGDFTFEIKEITRHQEAEINQALFDKIFGEGVVTTEEEFNERMKAMIAEQYAPQSDYKFMKDARALLIKKAGEVAFSDDLLKRWLMASNEKNTPESVDEDYPKIKEDLTYHLIKDRLIQANELKVEKEDIDNLAKRVTKAQLVQYGMSSIPDEMLTNFANDMLKNEDTLRNIVDRAGEEKLAAWLKEQVKIENKAVTAEEMKALLD